MAVFRVERNTGYTVMSNHHLRNKELSLKAKGLLSQMLSLPEDWDYTLAGLSHINREKIDAIREAVKELEKAGYIVRSRERDEKGRLRGADYVIYEQPQPREPEAATSGGQPPILDLPTLENPTLDNPTLEKPTQEKPTLENPTQLNKDILSKEQSITDLSSTDSIPFHSLNPLPFTQGKAATPPERKRTEAKSNSAVEIYREIIAYGHKRCSQKHKIAPQEKFCNHYAPCREVWQRGEKVNRYIGYDAGEVKRYEHSRKYNEADKKYHNRYPLIEEWGWNRDDCIREIKAAGLPQPGKSSCFFCPSMKKQEILYLKEHYPDLFNRAATLEENAMPYLKTVKGLGRSYSWKEQFGKE